MTWLLENPLPSLIVGGVVAAILGYLWTQSGRTSLLAGAIVAVLVTIGLLILEQSIMTDREQIDATLHRLAKAAEDADLDTILKYVEVEEARGVARGMLDHYKINRVSINHLVIRDVRGTPPAADVEFNAFVDVKGAEGAWRGPRFVEITMVKKDGLWKVVKFAHSDFTKGMQNRSPDGE